MRENVNMVIGSMFREWYYSCYCCAICGPMYVEKRVFFYLKVFFVLVSFMKLVMLATKVLPQRKCFISSFTGTSLSLGPHTHKPLADSYGKQIWKCFRQFEVVI